MNEIYTNLKSSVEALEVNLQKAEKGNKSAGLRLRKELKQIQSLCKELRSESFKAGK